MYAFSTKPLHVQVYKIHVSIECGENLTHRQPIGI